MPSPSTELALSWARAALAHFPLREPAVRFLGHSDNLTFRVEELGGSVYLLRLHRPVLDYWTGIRQQPEAIDSELTWLEALAWEGSFTVQQPIHTSSGALVALVDTGEPEPHPATLLTWLEGAHFSPSAGDGPELVERFGQLVARLHHFSERWTPPVEMIRPRYDYAHFKQTFARLLRGVDLGVFPEEVYWTLRAACQLVLNIVSELPDDPEHWGMIHADLHMGNFLVCGEQIIPIDFSFSGFGYYLYDLSVCLSGGLNAALRPAFLRGYRSVRPLPPEDARAVDAFVLAGRLSYYAYQIDNPTERSWLERRIREAAQNECSRFLQGQSLLDT